jgi:hypothetical protein
LIQLIQLIQLVLLIQLGTVVYVCNIYCIHKMIILNQYQLKNSIQYQTKNPKCNQEYVLEMIFYDIVYHD